MIFSHSQGIKLIMMTQLEINYLAELNSRSFTETLNKKDLGNLKYLREKELKQMEKESKQIEKESKQLEKEAKELALKVVVANIQLAQDKKSTSGGVAVGDKSGKEYVCH